MRKFTAINIKLWRQWYFAMLLLMAVAVINPVQAMEVTGVKIDESTQVEGKTLVLNGAGLRTKFIIKVYVASLYLPQKETNATAILSSTDNLRINLRLMRDVDYESLFQALKDGLKENVNAQEFTNLQTFINNLGEVMKKVGNVKEGNVVSLDFTAAGLNISLNSQIIGNVGNMADSRKMLLIWLGEHPVEEKLKKALLGG